MAEVIIGKGSYSYMGTLNVHSWNHPDEKLIIGAYCSIAENVHFYTGGNHSYKGFSTYPFKVRYLGHAEEAVTSGPIIIGDDVCIGAFSIIMSGATIGQGAIIGAGSVVRGKISPYDIVIGNPATYYRKRFPWEVVEVLLQADFNKLEAPTITQFKDLLYKELNTAEEARDLINTLGIWRDK